MPYSSFVHLQAALTSIAAVEANNGARHFRYSPLKGGQGRKSSLQTRQDHINGTRSMLKEYSMYSPLSSLSADDDLQLDGSGKERSHSMGLNNE